MSEKTYPTSLGEERVRLDFNPSNNKDVEYLKARAAEVIDVLEGMKATVRADGTSFDARLLALAQTAYEEAAMWAVKAATSVVYPSDVGVTSG